MEVSGEFVKMFAKVVDTMCIYEHTVYVNKILKGKSILKLQTDLFFSNLNSEFTIKKAQKTFHLQ